MSDLEKYIRNVQDFPKEGIGFKDITTLLKEGEAFYRSIEEFSKHFDPANIDKFVGIESRGFIFAAALAFKYKKGLILVRKPGKLPAETLKKEYSLEYGTDSIEIHVDAIKKGEKIVLVDDLLATGGTAAAAAELIKEAGGVLDSILFLIELDFLNGRAKLEGNKIVSMIHYSGE